MFLFYRSTLSKRNALDKNSFSMVRRSSANNFDCFVVVLFFVSRFCTEITQFFFFFNIKARYSRRVIRIIVVFIIRVIIIHTYGVRYVNTRHATRNSVYKYTR